MKTEGFQIMWRLTDWMQSLCGEQKFTVLNDGDEN